ncbi:DUF1707 SHOCT-like domain-containing protein [Streptomonospora litoralis]|uniref:DUF1707 domain-containing protein n=1 Tax=Streptomonospora litoralis TaxID=2498135 RepID=A0A4P6Q4S8_9ACTN|nr:DUF1707 domain-containing protein [Streptomonospora litoralis]QBI55708.1 hypothetical protein EKD16_19725 [Streptomonospora litoralis]
MGAEGDDRQLRASDGDRDEVARILQDAVGEGRITLDELAERLDLAYRARTYAELDPLTADLPVKGVAPPAPMPAASPDPGAPVSAEPATPAVIRATAGLVVRRGNWRVPERIEVSNPYGDTRLDFTEAHLLANVVDVVLHGPWGQTKIVLPNHATAVATVDTSWFGSFYSAVPDAPAPPAPHFRITGNIKGGALRVRYRRRVDDWMGSGSWGRWSDA